MAQYEWSEVFMSIEGEAKYSGHPTAYIRFARCNFKCKGFNNPTNDVQPNGYATLNFNPKDFKKLEDIPLLKRGCDSQYAVNDEFSHMWHKGNEKDLAGEVINVLPHGSFVNPVSGKRVILSLTGGEPTIRLKFWVPILEELYAYGMRDILVETNCAAPLRQKDIDALRLWQMKKNVNVPVVFGYNPERPVKIIWSNSPKLASSGEVWEDAIKPQIALTQVWAKPLEGWDEGRLTYCTENTEQYFKFVCGPNDTDFNEVAKAMEKYFQVGIPRTADVYIMPVACTEEQQQEISAKVAHMCMDRGYIYCHRIQNSVFGNGVGT